MSLLRRKAPVVLMALWDFLSVAFSVFIAFSLFPEERVKSDISLRAAAALIAFGLFFFVLLLLRGYSKSFTNMDVTDMCKEAVAAAFISVVGFGADRILDIAGFGGRIYIIFGMSLFIVSMLGRISGRVVIRLRFNIMAKKAVRRQKNDFHIRTIVYGAGSAGEFFYRRTVTDKTNVSIVAFLDDNPRLDGMHIGGVRVMGGLDRLHDAVKKYAAQQVVVAIPTLEPEKLQIIYRACGEEGVTLRRFATIDDLPNLPTAQVREINIEDLLHRDSVKLDMNVVNSFVRDRTVLVTGGAGSIGSEICRQVLRFGCKKLVVFDINENGLYHIDQNLREMGFDDGRFEVRLGSVRDRKRLDEVVSEFSPEIVFHAAAHKHVPMMEINPVESVKNNVFGTVNVCQTCVLHHVSKMILISTDKAVNPANVMGATKRIAELVLQTFNKACSDTDFAAVRFGNVLGSEGSVVPFFLKQIRTGGPVTVTHRDMRRYFMTIPEAVQLVLEAGAMAKGGEIFVLDMGTPVKIYDLACDLIRLSGYEPEKDVKISFTGLRPGEKLFEEISMAEEDVDHTSNEKIVVMKPICFDDSEIAQCLKTLQEHLVYEDLKDIYSAIQTLVPTFNHQV